MHIGITVKICYLFCIYDFASSKGLIPLPGTFTSSPVFNKVAIRDFRCLPLLHSPQPVGDPFQLIHDKTNLPFII